MTVQQLWNNLKRLASRFVQSLSYLQKVLLTIGCGALFGLLLYFVYLLRMPDYLGNSPAACVNCHVMTPYYATWMHSSHARNTTCNDCHVPHNNIVNKYFFKAKDGMGHVYMFLTRSEHQAIMAKDIDRMEKLGIYEVAPEDFALPEFVDTSKLELQKMVREGLDYLRQETI